MCDSSKPNFDTSIEITVMIHKNKSMIADQIVNTDCLAYGQIEP